MLLWCVSTRKSKLSCRSRSGPICPGPICLGPICLRPICHLSGTNLFGTYLSGTHLSGTHLSWDLFVLRLIFPGPICPGPICPRTHLSGTNLCGTHLSWDSFVWGLICLGPICPRTHLSGTHLSYNPLWLLHHTHASCMYCKINYSVNDTIFENISTISLIFNCYRNWYRWKSVWHQQVELPSSPLHVRWFQRWKLSYQQWKYWELQRQESGIARSLSHMNIWQIFFI